MLLFETRMDPTYTLGTINLNNHNSNNRWGEAEAVILGAYEAQLLKLPITTIYKCNDYERGKVLLLANKNYAVWKIR